MFDRVPSPQDLKKTPPAQRAGRVRAVEVGEKAPHCEFTNNLAKGLRSITESRELPAKSIKDLTYCLDLLACEAPIVFAWDLAIYEKPDQPYLNDEVKASAEQDHKSAAEVPLSQEQVNALRVANADYKYTKYLPYVVLHPLHPYWAIARCCVDSH